MQGKYIFLQPRIETNDTTLRFSSENLPTGLTIDLYNGTILGEIPFKYFSEVKIKVSGERTSEITITVQISENNDIETKYCDDDSSSNYGSITYLKCDKSREGVIRKNCLITGDWKTDSKDTQCYSDRRVESVTVQLIFQLNTTILEDDIPRIKTDLMAVYSLKETQIAVIKEKELLKVTVSMNKAEISERSEILLKVPFNVEITRYILNSISNDFIVDLERITSLTDTAATTKPSEKGPAGLNLAALIGGILGGLLLIIIVVLFIICRNRSKEIEKRNKELDDGKYYLLLSAILRASINPMNDPNRKSTLKSKRIVKKVKPIPEPEPEPEPIVKKSIRRDAFKQIDPNPVKNIMFKKPIDSNLSKSTVYSMNNSNIANRKNSFSYYGGANKEAGKSVVLKKNYALDNAELSKSGTYFKSGIDHFNTLDTKKSYKSITPSNKKTGSMLPFTPNNTNFASPRFGSSNVPIITDPDLKMGGSKVFKLNNTPLGINRAKSVATPTSRGDGLNRSKMMTPTDNSGSGSHFRLMTPLNNDAKKPSNLRKMGNTEDPVEDVLDGIRSPSDEREDLYKDRNIAAEFMKPKKKKVKKTEGEESVKVPKKKKAQKNADNGVVANGEVLTKVKKVKKIKAKQQ